MFKPDSPPTLTTVSLTRRSLTTLATLCDARAYNLRKMIEREELADGDEVSDAENDETYLIGLALMLREARDGR